MRLRPSSSDPLHHLIQQDGLADAAKSDQHHAFGGTPLSQSLDIDVHLLANSLASGKFRWQTASAESKGIVDWIREL